MWDFVLVLFAITLWMVSLFLVGEAAKSQKWVFGGTEGIPDPYSGVFMSQTLSLAFILLWLFRVFLLTQASFGSPTQWLAQFILRPGALTPGILMSSFPPLFVGVVKLITVLVVSRGSAGEELESRNRSGVTLLFLILHLVTGGAALYILVRFYL